MIRKLTALQAKVIGIDYLLDTQQPATPDLAAAIRDAKRQGVQFVFAKTQDNDGNWLQPLPEIADSQSVRADAVRSQGEDYYMPLLWQDGQALPFAVWLSWLHQRCVLRSTPICTQSNPAGLSDQVRQTIDTTIP